MTPAEFEWALERIELAYERREIGKLAFHRRMSALGFRAEAIKEWLRELEETNDIYNYS